MNKRFLIPILALLLLALAAAPVLAQDSAYRLNVKRNFGFSSGAMIKGNFSLSITGDLTQVQSVSYQIDGQEIQSTSQPDFAITFRTEDYPLGWHDLIAAITTKDGKTVETAARRFQFVSPDEEFAAVRNIIVPLFGGVLALVVLGVGAQMLFMRDRRATLAPGAQRTYGIMGGTICPRCKRPYSIHFWAINLGLKRLDRCDFCGKWAMVNAKSPAELRAAELAEIIEAAPTSPLDAEQQKEEDLRRMLDDSRYTR